MENDTSPYARAVGALTELFLEQACSASDFSELESLVIDCGHGCMAEAFGLALEALDAQLLADKPMSLQSHDIRRRTLATEIGDVVFSLRRYRDRYGRDVYLLAEALDIPYGARVSPGAAEFLVQSGAQVSYLMAARLMARHGSSVRPTTVMRCLREVGLLCAEEDEQAAISLYSHGVVPEAECVREEICLEADGTYFHAQGLAPGSPRRFEVKAMVAYEGKSIRSGKVRRTGCVHHALVGKPEQLWSEGIASTGNRYDLSKLKRVHLGADGEAWCQDAGRYLPSATVTVHLDPFHVNRAIMACFADTRLAWNVIDVVNDGGKQEAIALIKAACDLGLARQKQASAVVSYLEGNLDAVAVEGPSLGTMESENQHLYGARMDSFPCAWSLRGASDMARIISRRETGTPIPRKTRDRSVGERRRSLWEKKELSCYESKGGAGKMVESVGKGYMPPHQVDTRKVDRGKAYALYRGMAALDRGI